jgi:uncharacterized protein (TIGR03545 family)
VRQYLPERKKEDASPVAFRHERGAGRTYEFGRPNSYPLFWLKRAAFSSRGENTDFGGNVSGELTDVASAPRQLGKPVRLELLGDFPRREIRGARVGATVDLTGEALAARLRASVEAFPVADRVLSDAENLRFRIAQAIGSLSFEGSYSGESVDFSLRGAFRNASYAVETPSRILESILRGVTAELAEVTLAARIGGTWKAPELEIESNLARALGAGLAKQFEAQLAQARKKIDQELRSQVAEKKAELDREVARLRGQVLGQVEQARKQAASLEASLQAKLRELRAKGASAGKQLGDTLKERGLKKLGPAVPPALKKKLPF